MYLGAGIWLLLLGVLGASNLIIAKKPDAKELIAKISPYQGWIGAVSALWGAWIIVHALLNIGLLSKGLRPMIWWITYLGDGVIQLALGLLLGIGVLKTFISQPDAVRKMDQTVERLAPKQGMLGVIALCLGLWVIIAPYLLLR